MDSLYEISKRYAEILEIPAESEDERSALVNALNEAEGDFRDKAENVVKYVKNIQGFAEAIRAEELRLAEKRHTLEKKAENLIAYLEAMMLMTNQKNIKAGIFELKFVKNPPAVKIIDETLIPKEYFVQPAPIVSKEAIRNAIKSGVVVPGTEIVQEERLKIK